MKEEDGELWVFAQDSCQPAGIHRNTRLQTKDTKTGRRKEVDTWLEPQEDTKTAGDCQNSSLAH